MLYSNDRRRIFRVIIALLTLAVASLSYIFFQQDPASSASLNQEVPTVVFPDNPTPWPTINLPPMTPVPTYAATPTDEPIAPSDADLQPSDLSQPLRLIISAVRSSNTEISVKESASIIIGRVKEILPAIWVTPDGKRPKDLQASDYNDIIMTPVLIEVEQFLRGSQSQTEILIYAVGGFVEPDEVKYTSDDLYEFIAGERVVVFIRDRGAKVGDNPRLEVVERYTVWPDETVSNTYRTLTLKELLQEISLVTTLPTVVSTAQPVR
jgi:hypothetical protein